MAVEAEGVERDRYFPRGEDFKGRILSAQPVRTVNYVKAKRKREKIKNSWRKLRSFLPYF